MKIDTHLGIDQLLCGLPLSIEPGHSRVELKTTPNMAVDHYGLIHGGFIFGLADYAAMLAVNHPNVVLSGSEVKFLKPSKVSDLLIADAIVDQVDGKKHIVSVSISNDNVKIFDGRFTCIILENHVLKHK